MSNVVEQLTPNPVNHQHGENGCCDKAGVCRKGGASKARSKFSPGIATAMAEQWG